MKKIVYIISTIMFLFILTGTCYFTNNKTPAKTIVQTITRPDEQPWVIETTTTKTRSKEDKSRLNELIKKKDKYSIRIKTKVKILHLDKYKYSYKNKKYIYKTYFKINKKGSSKFKISIQRDKIKGINKDGTYKFVETKHIYPKLYKSKKNIYYIKIKTKTPIKGGNFKIKKTKKGYYSYYKNKKIKKTKYFYCYNGYGCDTDPFIIGNSY